MYYYTYTYIHFGPILKVSCKSHTYIRKKNEFNYHPIKYLIDLPREYC